MLRFKPIKALLRKGSILLVLSIIFYAAFRAYDNGYQQQSQQQHCLTVSAVEKVKRQGISLFADRIKSTDDVSISQNLFDYLSSQLLDTPYPGAKNYTEYVVAKSRLKPIVGVEPLRPDFGAVVNDVTSFRYPITIRPCQNTQRNGTASLFVAVISAVNYFDKRNVIRETWLNHLHQMLMYSNFGMTSMTALVGFAFIVGLTENDEIQKRIEAESAAHGDIIQVDMNDVYYNLTQKVVGLVNWMNRHCSQVDFILKVDDDVYVNVRNLVTVIASLEPSEQSVYGTSADGIVRREGRFGIALEDWPWSHYPVYSMGASVLIPGCVLGSLLAASQTIPYFPFEDTYLIGLCAAKAGIRVRLSDSMLGGLTTSLPEPCQVYKTVTWLTDSVDSLKESHLATNDFYQNVTQCLIFKKVNGKRLKINSMKIQTKISFQ